ncbi:hypothetical protein KCU89_g19515, partial [Aureobasidium melanogenum]
MAADRTSKKRARAEAISPNGSDDHVLSTATMPIRTAKDAALADLGLVDFLQHDPRPTCIVDTAAAYIAYRNPALERLLAGTWNLQHFRDWATALSPQSQPQPATYGGRAW